MGDSFASARRRHILSSINPDSAHDGIAADLHRREPVRESPTPPPRSPPPAAGSSRRAAVDDEPDEGDTTKPRRSRLKLKDHRSRRRTSRDRRRDRAEGDDSHHRSSRHDRSEEDGSHRRSSRRHHRHRRRHKSPTPPNPHEPAALDPEAAFRQSLFDAMADDEGAAYWEGVYGQPVHVYPSEKVGPTGELEQMTEEEYAAYVRQKMWEKTHAGLLEERARREEARKRKEAEERHGRRIQDEMERSLRRGEERRQRRRWAGRWDEYARAWAGWDGAAGAAGAAMDWPVESGRREDVGEEAVRAFFLRGLGRDEVGQAAFVAQLKDERVRWHPDKMQQRLGGQVDDEVMKGVTAVFQIIDRLWAEMRPKT